MNVHDHVFQSISGTPMPLNNWLGQPLLLVNTASESRFTPQLAKLQRLHNDYSRGGLVTIAMPCNDFDGQEPGSEAEIYTYYWDEYQVRFPVTRKIIIQGLGTHPFFQSIRETYGSELLPRDNFYKYLFDRRGQFIDFWPSKISPDDPLMTHQIERQLQSWIL